MKTLDKTMTDFVLDSIKEYQQKNDGTRLFSVKPIDDIEKYAKLLSQPLTLGMFVPCDEEGNVLKGKPLSPAEDSDWIKWENEQEDYFKALDKVIFEGFEIKDLGDKLYRLSNENEGFTLIFRNFNDRMLSLECKSVEDLIQYKLKLK